LRAFSLGDIEADSDSEAGRYPLCSGTPCMVHKCVECCIETRMPLTRSDIERIKKHGYRVRAFVVKRGGERRLKNVNGRCVFLGESGCTLYSYRPEGCRLYPFVFDEDAGRGVIHDFCPYGHEFKVSEDDLEKLYALVKKLYKIER